MDAIIRKLRMTLHQGVYKIRNPSRHADCFYIGFDKLPQLLRNGFDSMSERERFGRVQVEEDTDEDSRHNSVHFVLCIYPMRIMTRLQR